jgi:hypothetical protein
MTVNLSCFAGVGQQLFDNSGIPLSGGLIYSYLAGTTTPAVTYTSSSGATAHPNPIVLDSAGRVPSGEIWVTPDQLYKYVVKTSTGVTLNTYDNIPSITSIGDLTSPILTPIMFGAVGDGVTNDTVAMNAMFNAAARRTIDGLAKTYRVVPDTIIDPYATAGVGYGLNKAWFCIRDCNILQNIGFIGDISFGNTFWGKHCQANTITITGDCRISAWYCNFDGLIITGTTWFGGDLPPTTNFNGFYYNTFTGCNFVRVICDQRYGPVNLNTWIESRFTNFWVKNTGYVGYTAGYEAIQSFHMNQILACETFTNAGEGITAPDGFAYGMVIGDSLGNGVTSGGINRIIGLYNESSVRGLYGDSWQLENIHFSGDTNNKMGGGQIAYNIPFMGEPAPQASEDRVAPAIYPMGNVSWGGDWSILNSSGYPYCFELNNMSGSVGADATEPTGLNKALTVSGLAFSNLVIKTSVLDNGSALYTACSFCVIYKQLTGDTSFEVYDPGTNTIIYGATTTTRLANGWVMAYGMTGGYIRMTSGGSHSFKISAVSVGRGAGVMSAFTNQQGGKPLLDLSGATSLIGDYVASRATWGNTGVKTVNAASSTDWYTIDFGAFTGKAATVKVVANYASSAGGVRCATRESLINEDGSGVLVEQNITNITGVNMTLSFVLAGALLTVRTTTSAATSETARIGIQVIGGGMGNSQITIL